MITDGRALAGNGAREVIVLLKAALLAFAMSCGTDAASSHYALANRGAHEGGVLLTQNAWANDGILVGSTAGVAHIAGRTQHRTLATIGLLGLTSLHAWATIHNAQIARR